MIKVFKERAWMFLAGCGLILLVFSFISGDQNVDIQIDNTYVVALVFQLGLTLGIALLVQSLVYYLMRKERMVNWMTILHIIVSIVFGLLLSNGQRITSASCL